MWPDDEKAAREYCHIVKDFERSMDAFLPVKTISSCQLILRLIYTSMPA